MGGLDTARTARCGFTREGTLRCYERFKGSRPDVVSRSRLPTDPRPWRRDESYPGNERERNAV